MTRIITLTAALMLLAAAAFASSGSLASMNDGLENFHKATLSTGALYLKGNTEAAKATAEALLLEAEKYRDDWNYGNAVHTANTVLGLIALDSGDKAEAGKRLLAAGRTKGSPQLDTFGPNMLLAKRLIEEKESAVVLEYFALREKFWTKGSASRIAEWMATVKGAGTPDFGANLRYQL